MRRESGPPGSGTEGEADPVDTRLGARLSELRAERGWSLGELADRSGVSRSTLSRAERAEISPTAALLNRLCAVYGRTMSQLLSEVESAPAQVVRAADQPVWRDEASGFLRRSVSPPLAGLRAEIVEGTLEPYGDIAYDRPPVPGLEQHIWVLDGLLDLTVQSVTHRLAAGDCLRFRLWGPTHFHCPGPEPVRYALMVVLP
ncbi:MULTISPECIES: helix-turn-helix domain-containing protein [unclassified Streptomyces]|uniref:helix-turn-helix domain-containing protein n=1 Tax=unclassified Streptomyces TaxID=2593676 RepID=UPI000DBA9B91|nr:MULTISPECIES: helix-turn-helix domain-containing protein [unclassified Streptomyces]MYT74575.1 helix-turn-helix domain-containing protein [Streptomyces sp. SID8367]RAJ91558.1 transcriptional regulator with XRE-family HTH domain [Streptomyces sp. PsTaAH-137]